MKVKWQTDLPTTILWLFAYLLLEIFQEAIKDFQEVLDGLFVSSDNIFPCENSHLKKKRLYCSCVSTQADGV